MQKKSVFCIKYERNDKKKKMKKGATIVAAVTERVKAKPCNFFGFLLLSEEMIEYLKIIKKHNNKISCSYIVQKVEKYNFLN